MRQRNNSISFRLSDNELQALNALQEKTGLPKNALITKLVSGAKLIPSEYSEELKKLTFATAKLVEQTRRIGVNFNMIVRTANTTGNIDAIDELSIIGKQLESLTVFVQKLWAYTSQSTVNKL